MNGDDTPQPTASTPPASRGPAADGPAQGSDARPARNAEPPKPGARGVWVVAGLMAAATAVVLGFMPEAPQVPYRLVRITPEVTDADATIRVELQALTAKREDAALVLSVAGDTVSRKRLPLTHEEPLSIIEARASDVVGDLSGSVELIVLTDSGTDPLGRLEPREMRDLLKKLARSEAVGAVTVRPPVYGLALTPPGSDIRARPEAVESSSTAIGATGPFVVRAVPPADADGALDVHVFATREGAAEPSRLQPKIRREGVEFTVLLDASELFGEAQSVRLEMVIGPKGTPAPSRGAWNSAPWRTLGHSFSRAPD